MRNLKHVTEVPYFTLHLTQPAKGDWYIMLNGEVIHHIKSILAFYRILGYPDIPTNIFEKKENFSQDEVLLNEYIQTAFRDGIALGFDHCLQYKITKYLIENCEQFKETYGEYYNNLIETCKSESKDGCKGFNSCL